MAAEYSNRGLEVKETAAGFRIQVRREFASEISRLWPERPARYSRALLETLALIAYRQPITRAEIEAVRGVAVNPNIVKTVIERNWVRVVGHRDVPGRPELLGTTREFLDYFGLRSLDELPPLAELKAMGDYNLQLELPNAGRWGLTVRLLTGRLPLLRCWVVMVSAAAGEGGEVGVPLGRVEDEAGADAAVRARLSRMSLCSRPPLLMLLLLGLRLSSPMRRANRVLVTLRKQRDDAADLSESVAAVGHLPVAAVLDQSDLVPFLARRALRRSH